MIASVRKARHDARNAVRHDTAKAKAVRDQINGLLDGVEGLSPDEQAQRLRQAKAGVAELQVAYAEAAEALANSDAPQILEDAAVHAETRDFAAWQQQKADAGQTVGDGVTALPATDGDGFVIPTPVGELPPEQATALLAPADGQDEDG